MRYPKKDKKYYDTLEKCMEEVKKNGAALKEIPHKMQTYEMCIEAVANCPESIIWAKREFITEDLSKIAIERRPHLIQFAYSDTNCPVIPRTKEILLYAVNLDPYLIKDVYEPTEELCIAAVSKNGIAICDIPKKYLTEKICLAAANNASLCLRYLDKEYKTEKVCLTAVRNEGYVLEFIQDEQNMDICLEAIHSRPRAFKYVKEEFRTPYLCKLAIDLDPFNIIYIDKSKRTEEQYLAAIRRAGYLIATLSNPSEKMCRLAINNNPENIKYIDNPSKEVCLLAVEKDPWVLKYIKNPCKDVIEKAISLYGNPNELLEEANLPLIDMEEFV